MVFLILHGQKKKVLKEIIRYFVETTELQYNDFILSIDKARGRQESELAYPEWLANKSMQLLSEYEITYKDILENKDTINAAINEDSSRNEGEFFTPESWAKDGRDYLEAMVGDLWGKANIWEGSCGSGNLLRTAGYPTDKLFMSSLLPEDIEIVKATPEFQGATAFKLDFLEGIDLDENNMNFSDKLPSNLRQVLENDEPLIIYMNPPYKVLSSKTTDVGSYMSSKGMAKCALDLFHQFMYRIVLLKRTYNLTNVYLGIFGPITMYHSKMIEPLYNEFKEEFTFDSGMCFDAGDFANTSESVGWIIGYTCWRTKQPGDTDKPMVLEAKTLGGTDTPTVIGSRLVTSVDVNLHNWVAPEDVVRMSDRLPTMTTYSTFTEYDTKVPDNALAYMMSSNFVLRATRRACVTTLPTNDAIHITQENFWRCVASFAARRTYASKQNPYNNCQYYSAPNTSVEGYDQWLRDALILFLFDYDAQHASYRNVEFKEEIINLGNAFFPISKDIASQVITDPTLAADLANSHERNQFILSILQQQAPYLSEEAKDLYEFGLQMLLESLAGTKRGDVGYKNWLQSWDAGFIQLRDTEGMLTSEQQERYTYLVSKLKYKLYDGIYKYGFMMDTAFAVEDEDAYEDDELDELSDISEQSQQEVY